MVYRRTERGNQRYTKRQAEIVAAARRLFAEYGYDGATMQQVVREAGTSIGNCYFYFPNKEALLLVVVREIIGEIWGSADAALDRLPSGAEKLAYVFYESIRLLLDHEELGGLMLRALSVPAVHEAIVDDYRKRVRQLIRDYPSLFSGVDIDLKINAAQGAGIGLLEMKLHGESDDSTDHIGKFLARFNLQALGLPQAEVDEALATLEQTGERRKTKKAG
jgi:AcrR family transcriptional regulator